MEKQDRGLPLGVIVLAVFAIVTFVSWGIMAASYAEATDAAPEFAAGEGMRMGVGRARRTRFAIRFAIEGIGTFIGNSFTMLPQLPAVFSWHFSNRLWLPILLGTVQAGVLGGGLVMKKMERSFYAPPRVKRRQIALPQISDDD